MRRREKRGREEREEREGGRREDGRKIAFQSLAPILYLP